MPLWAWIVIAVLCILAIAGGIVGGIFAYRAATRRTALRLIRARESLDVVRQALGESLSRLAEGSERELTAFADDPDSGERRALHEVAARARLLADELDSTALPAALIPAAESLGDAAYLISQEADKVKEEMRGEQALDALGSIDLRAVETYYRAALAAVGQACEECGVQDAAVYGGGLYL